MHFKLTRKNRNGEERELVVNTDNIAEITEIDPREEVAKYSEDTGEPVEFKTTRRYVLGFTNGKTYEITEDSANALMSALVK